MKRREIAKDVIEPSGRASELDPSSHQRSSGGTSKSHIIPMDIDEMEIDYDENDEKEFSFLARKPKRKINLEPLVVIEWILSDGQETESHDDDHIEDDDGYIEKDDDHTEDDDDHSEDDDDYIEDDDDSEQVVNFDAPETSYGGDIPNRNIDQSFA